MEVVGHDKFIASFNPKLFKGNNKAIYSYNDGVSLDIETTSFYINDKYQVTREKTPLKGANMYIWMMANGDTVTTGRTWGELLDMLNALSVYLKLNEKRKVIVYIHNLAYEFQFMRAYFNWISVFALDNRKPVKALTTIGIEFRCSYILTNKSLKKLSESTKYNKMLGDLDYSLLRHSKTVLTEKELGYCYNDVLIITDYIRQEIKANKNINHIPLTSTGYVRRHCRKKCLGTSGYYDYIHQLNINSMEQFYQLRRAFQGGFTHANSYHVGDDIEHVHSYDFTSSYPYVMLVEKYPDSSAFILDSGTLQDMDDHPEYLYIYDIEFINLLPAELQENPLSFSRCYRPVNPVVNNGRVVCAERISTTITSVDMEYLRKFYTWDEIIITNIEVFMCNYLPQPLRECILEFYEKKTTLKNVAGKEDEYMRNKALLNSIYGMAVTNTLKEQYEYQDEWTIKEQNYEEELFQQNQSGNRFLYYPWGVFVTAYARRNLFTAIYELGDDYIYSDTDSVKFINLEKHTQYFEDYNNQVLEKISMYGKRAIPKTVKGVEKPIGVWDYEGVYDHFKTLGAKRYLYSKDGEYYITVAGLNKKLGAEFIAENGGFNVFANEMAVPAEKSGRLTHTYIDGEINVMMKDLNGVWDEVHQVNAVHLEPSDYNLSLAQKFIDYLTSIDKGGIIPNE